MNDSTDVTWDEELDSVVVMARRPIVTLKGDTTEINAEMLKAVEGAYLKDLLRRVPGLVYDEKAGTLKFNGKVLVEIQLNGKPFFHGDLKTPLENLPAKVISKLKVYNKQSDTEKALGIRSGKEQYVLDLQTKKELDRTAVNSIAMYGGTSEKLQGEIGSNYFESGGDNLSLDGTVGNRDVASPGKGNMYGSLGTNFSHKFSERFAISGNLQYGRSKISGSSSSYSEEYLQTNSRYSLSQGKNTSDNHNVGGYVTMNWKIDNLTEANFEGSYDFSKGTTASENRNAAVSMTLDGVDVKMPFDAFDLLDDARKVNDISSSTSLENHSRHYSFDLHLIRRLNKKGSVISVSTGNTAARNRSDETTDNRTRFFQLTGSGGVDSVLTQRRLSESPYDNNNFHVGMTFVQPVAKNLKLQLSYDYTHTVDRHAVNTFDRGRAEAVTEIDSLSSYTHAKTTGHDMALSVNYDNGGLLVSLAGHIVPGLRSLDSKVGSAETDTVMHVMDYRSDATIQYKWEDSRLLAFSYMLNTFQPDITLLVPLTNNTDPLNISSGNPRLKAFSSHYFSLRYEDMKKGLSLYGAYNLQCNNIVQATIYNEQTGVRTTRPENIHGNWNANGYVNWWHAAWRLFTLSLSGTLSYIHQVNLVSESGTAIRSYTDNMYAMSTFGINYTPSWGTFYFRTSYNYAQYDNSLRGSSNYTHSIAMSLNGAVNLPCAITLETNADYTYRAGNMVSDDDRNVVVWNMKAMWRFMKEKKMELSLAWNDILNNRKNYYRNATAAGFSETYTDVVKSYFMIGLAYKFQLGGGGRNYNSN